MRRVLSSIALALLCGGAVAAPAPAGFTVEPLSPPASNRALPGSLAAAPDGAVWLGWSQRSDRTTELRCARLGLTGGWRTARTIVAWPSMTSGANGGPVLAIAADGMVYALGLDRGGRAWLTHSSDAGVTWTAPAPWLSSGDGQRAFTLTPLAGGGVLVTWFEPGGTGGGMRLYARVIGAGTVATQLVDGAAADAGAAAGAAFLDGGARLAYRRAGAKGGIVTVRLAQGRWQPPQSLAPESRLANGSPADGPRLATDGSRMAAAWFTTADHAARLEATFSPDAGERWLMPLRIDHGHPAGPLDLVLLRDRTMLVTWLDANGSLWLRRISPEFSPAGQVQLAGPGTAAPTGCLQMALCRDYAGERGTAEVVVVYAPARAGQIGAIRVTVAEGELLAAERNCDCLPTPADLRGFAIRGRIIAIDAAAHRVRVKHDEVPGVFAAGEDESEVTVPLLAQAHLGRPFLGHIAQGHAGWQLLDTRYLGAPVGD